MIIAGIGCRRGASAAAVTAAIEAALAGTGLSRGALRAVATAESKRRETGIAVAASAFGVPLILVSRADLEAASARILTRSARVLALTGVPSIAEAAALAAGGSGARLLAPRLATGPATCALAAAEAAS